MEKNFRKFMGVAVLGLALALPNVIHADNMVLMGNVGDDDEAHFHFRSHHHHPMIKRAAMQLVQAKHTLWAAATDFGGHKAQAIMAINHALDELAQADAFANSHGH